MMRLHHFYGGRVRLVADEKTTVDEENTQVVENIGAPGAARLGRTRYIPPRVRCLRPTRYDMLRVGSNPFGDTRFRNANADENASD
jgi:hypothetical protein